jgi:phosphopantetheinyl transferase
MPLYKTIQIDEKTQILVWEITESYEQLRHEVELNEKNTIRLNGMKSELHQRGFLSVRKLLQEAGYSDFDLFYDEFGKPHLKDGKHISITHSYTFSAIILSDQNIGIDMEMQREKIIKIADKFVDCEFEFLNQENKEDYIQRLTVIWGVKEAIFKIRNEEGISFKDHIKVDAFEMENKTGVATLYFEGAIHSFKFHFEEIHPSPGSFQNEQAKQNFMLVSAFENN